MASAQFRLIGHSLRIFQFLQDRPDEWHDILTVSRAVGITPGTASPAMRTLQRNYYAILEMRSVGELRDRAWIHSVESPGEPCCGGCGARLTGGREAMCKVCLPLDPAKPHPDVQPGSPTKASLLTERYAAGLPLWPEPYTSPMPGRASEERIYDDRHIPR